MAVSLLGARSGLGVTVAIGLIAALAVASSGCGLKKRHRCTASATYEGKTRTGRGDDFDSEVKAKELAAKDLCLTYCRVDDPGVEAAYVKARGGPAATDPIKEQSNRFGAMTSEPVKPVFDACQAKCDTTTATQVSQSCEYSGI
jgi:hypothetical protein